MFHVVPKREGLKMMLVTCWRSRSVALHCVTKCLEQKIILQEDKTYLRTSCLSVDRILTNDWLIPHPPYSPNLVSRFRKEWVATNEAAVCLHAAEMDFYGKENLKFLEGCQNRVYQDGNFAAPVNTAQCTNLTYTWRFPIHSFTWLWN
jgi:hypothetical protein